LLSTLLVCSGFPGLPTFGSGTGEENLSMVALASTFHPVLGALFFIWAQPLPTSVSVGSAFGGIAFSLSFLLALLALWTSGPPGSLALWRPSWPFGSLALWHCYPLAFVPCSGPVCLALGHCALLWVIAPCFGRLCLASDLRALPVAFLRRKFRDVFFLRFRSRLA